MSSPPDMKPIQNKLLSNPDYVADVKSGNLSLRKIAKKYGVSRWSVTETLSRIVNEVAPAVSKLPDAWTIPPFDKDGHYMVFPKEETPKKVAQGGQWKRFVVASDVHGDKQDAEANSKLFNFIEGTWKPEIRIMAGDLWDFRPLRRNCSGEEKRESMQEDYTAGLGWLLRFRPQYFLRGNHDERLWDLAAFGSGIEQDFAVEKVRQVEPQLDSLGVRMLPYHIREGILELGHLKVAHGFYNGVHCAKQMADAYQSVLFGHNHAVISHPVAGLDRRAARCIGALCQLIMNYNSRTPSALRQAHGFAYGVINESTGVYHVWQAEAIEGTWVLPSDVVEI